MGDLGVIEGIYIIEVLAEVEFLGGFRKKHAQNSNGNLSKTLKLRLNRQKMFFFCFFLKITRLNCFLYYPVQTASFLPHLPVALNTTKSIK